MYLSMDCTVKGVVKCLLSEGVPIESLFRDGKRLPKRELVDMANGLEFAREQAVFREHVNRLPGNPVVRFN